MIKITSYTPKGKAKTCSKNFAIQYFGALQKPIETKVVSDKEFYYVYEYDKPSKRDRIINKKIPKAEMSIRNFYTIIIHLVERGNKIAKKGAWKIERTKRWIMKQLRRKVKNPKGFEDFIDAVELTDKKQMMIFLSKPLFDYEVWEVEE